MSKDLAYTISANPLEYRLEYENSRLGITEKQ